MTTKSHYLLIKYWSHPQVLTSKLIWSDPWDQWLWSKEIKCLGTEKKKGGREIERETKKERDHTGDKKEGHWGKWIETDRCEETDIEKGREIDAALDVLVNFCLSALVKMSHINVQINGHLIFQPAPYCHHQMALLLYLLMTRAEFPPLSVSVLRTSLDLSWFCAASSTLPCVLLTLLTHPHAHTKRALDVFKIWSKVNFLSLFIMPFKFHLVLQAFFLSHFWPSSCLLQVVGKATLKL